MHTKTQEHTIPTSTPTADMDVIATAPTLRPPAVVRTSSKVSCETCIMPLETVFASTETVAAVVRQPSGM
jgi:hypothetical protein